MSNHEKIINTSAAQERQPRAEEFEKRGIWDYFSIVVATCGVGYAPIAPGTFGSAVGVIFYLAVVWAESVLGLRLSADGWRLEQISSTFFAVNLVLLFFVCLIGIWASTRGTKLFQSKDPSKVVVDEVMGQLVVFLFVPVGLTWSFILAGFLLFRLFDIWKPYPVNLLESLPRGLGICADDLLAGVYAGICLAVIYAVSLNL
jgi:phosphatidylglycerophosphatase A